MKPISFLRLALCLFFLLGSHARADVCTASMTDISFGNVSPVSGLDYYASGTLSVTCTFVILVGNIIVLPNISVCANLGPGPNAPDINSRVLSNGALRIPFNLYRAATYTPADVWGGYATSSSIKVFFAGLLAIGTNTQTFPVFARIAANDLALAAVVANGPTSYATSFAGAGTLNYASSSIIALDCQTSGIVAPFSFNVRADVINDCLIFTTPVDFGARGILDGTARATGMLSVKCTAANSYRIALNGGNANAPASRKLRNAATGDTVDYHLSATPDGAIWGDGLAGTATYDNTGTGNTQQITIYGRVPSQSTPPPGDYSDRVTATIYF
jgi:spore coat protein U-like protein